MPKKSNMIKPITIYGNPVLRKECVNIDETYPSIREVIETMWGSRREDRAFRKLYPQYPIRK